MSTLTTHITASRDSHSTGLCKFNTTNKAIEVSDGTNWLVYDYDTRVLGTVTSTRSLSFDGSNDFVSFAGDADLALSGASAATLAGWVNVSNTSTNQHLFGANTSVFSGELWGSANVIFLEMGGSNFFTASNYRTYITQGDWHHIAFVFDGNGAGNADRAKIYVDGTSLSGTYSGTVPTTIPSITNWYLGKGSYNVYYNGLMDEMALWVGTALSTSDIQSLYGSGPQGTGVIPNPEGLTDAPEHFWRFEETSGTTITDQGSGGNDGTLTNGPTFSTNVPTFNQYSVSLDGSDDYMDIPDSTALETTEFTWSAWFYCTAIDRYNIIVDTATNSITFNGYELFVVNTTNKIRFASYHASSAIDSTTVVSANTWFHVAATHESGSDKLYVNGTLEASGSASSFSVSDAANLRIGSSSIFSLYHQGLIDEVSFFNSALSASNVTAIYNSGVPNDIGINGLNLNPVGWWRMGNNDGGSGTTITNQGSASSIDGTLTNGPTFSTTVPS